MSSKLLMHIFICLCFSFIDGMHLIQKCENEDKAKKKNWKEKKEQISTCYSRSSRMIKLEPWHINVEKLRTKKKY